MSWNFFVSFTYGEDRLHFGNKRKKSTFSLYFTQFALSLQGVKKKNYENETCTISDSWDVFAID